MGAGCSSSSVLVGATVSRGGETGWEEQEGTGNVGSLTVSLPRAPTALSQPGFQVSWNRIQSYLCQDGNLIQPARLQAPASPLAAAKPALGTGRVTAGDSPQG